LGKPTDKMSGVAWLHIVWVVSLIVAFGVGVVVRKRAEPDFGAWLDGLEAGKPEWWYGPVPIDDPGTHAERLVRVLESGPNRAAAARALSYLRPAPAAARSALVDAVQEEGEVADQAAFALCNLGPQALPAAEALCSVESGPLMLSLVLRSLGPEVIPILIQRLRNEHTFFEVQIIRALELFGPRAVAAVPVLRAHAERHPEDRDSVEKALREILK
jgi:hypothetical protein